jgi:selenide,water dikinase
MGGEPIMAIAILGWPISKIPGKIAGQVLDGSRKVCADAGIPLAGGHSIDCPEPVFGLAVTGKVKKQHLKRNDTAKAGSFLYLTKPLGVGITTTAQKKNVVEKEHLAAATSSMLKLNNLGAAVGKLSYVNAMTDVTGFGLLGHLCEVCEGSELSANIDIAHIPQFDFLDFYIQQKCIPGGTIRNWDSYGSKVSSISEDQQAVLADPQTSGGLLISVDSSHSDEFEKFLLTQGYELKPFGKLIPKARHVINVR